MAITNNSYRDMENDSFVECPAGSGLPVKAVKVCNEPVDAIPVIVNPVTLSKITNLSLPVIDTEVAHALVANLKEIIIRNRDKAEIKFSFVLGESGTKYVTLNAGAVLSLDSLKFTGETIYLQSPKVSTVEILELS